MIRTFVAALALASASLAAPSARAQTDPDLPRGQLSDAVVPAAYRLDLTVDPAKPGFSGKVEIDATLKAATSRIYLHGRDLDMRGAVATVDGKRVVGKWSQADDTGVARLDFAQPLPAGSITLAFDYAAPFQEGPTGMFHVRVGDDWYSWTQFESIDARAAFPGFDDPGFKTPFTVTLRTPPGLKAVSNTPETATTREGGLDVHRFAQTPPLPTYLVAMMTGPFAMAGGEVPPTPQRAKPLPIRVVSTKQNAGQLQFALEGSKQIVTRLEDYFGESFPFPKLDQVTSPVQTGAMENAGADLYQDDILVMDDNAPVPQKRRFGMVVSHELAHQWFGDLVTPKWWDDIWLNESFANWMGYRVGNEWRPDLNIRAGAVAEGFGAMNTDALLAGRPIRQNIDSNEQIDAAFDSITYGKGGQVVAMIAGYMGDAKFRDGVRRYMAGHRYGNATSTEFFAAMAEAAGDPRIVPAMRSFTDQQGVPLLTFARGGRGYVVTQSRYAAYGTTAPDTRWGIPLCVRRDGVSQCNLMNEAHVELWMSGKGPLVPNAGGTGYYRFELPKKDWDALIRQSASLPGPEAQAVVDSLLASFRAGRADTGQLVALARRMADHPDSYAADAAGDALEYLSRAGLIDDKARPNYQTFVDRLYAPILARYGFDPQLGVYAKEDPERAQRRAQLVGRIEDYDPALRRKLGDAAKAWMAGDAKALDPAWYVRAFGVYLSEGGLPAAQALIQKALASEDPLLRPSILGALGSTGKDDVARWLLDTFQDSRLRASEKRGLLANVTATAGTRDYGYGWLKAHLDQLMKDGGIFYSAKLPAMLNGFCSADKADEFVRDLGPRFTGKTGELEFRRAIERVRNCAALKTARRAEVSKAVVALKVR